MTPRTVGILGMIGAVIAIVWCAALIANPRFGILGALGVVAGAILFAISATLTARRSWTRSHWPEMRVREVEQIEVGQPTTPYFAKNLLGGAVAWGGTGAILVLLGHDSAWTSVWVGLILAAVALIMWLWVANKAHPK